MLFFQQGYTEGISEPILTNNISKRVSPMELHAFGVYINDVTILGVKIPQSCLKLAE